MKLTAQEQQTMALRAQWYFDCSFGQNTQDSVVFTGDGVDDLDSIISRIDFAGSHGGINIKSRFLADVGSQYTISKPFDLEDLRAIRVLYISFYGTVNKPTVTERSNTAAVSIKAL